MKNLFDLSGRRALVVGGTSGIGKAIALGLADAGADVAATGRRAHAVREVAESIRHCGRATFEESCDASNSASLASLRARVENEFAGLDVLVYAAGVTLKRPAVELASDEWQGVLDTNVKSCLATCQQFYPLLKASPRARILTIASLTSFVAFDGVAAYGTSKAALLALTKSLACEWARDGIVVNALVPGVFVTDLNRELLTGTPRGHELLMRTPMGRFGNIDETVGPALFLCSEAAEFVTGISLPVDGGFLASGVNQ